MEKIIEEKMQKQQSEEYYDAFDYMLSSAKENGHELSMQELKVNYSLKKQPSLVLCIHSSLAIYM